MNLLHLRKYLSIFAGKILCRRAFLKGSGLALCGAEKIMMV